MKRFFSNEQPWYEPYELIEFIIKSFYYRYDSDRTKEVKLETEKYINEVLASNLSGFRLINNEFTPITNIQEIEAIKEASTNTDEYQTVSSHLDKALELLADKKAPDFSNSIKESISAIESYFKVFFQKPTISFGDGLNNLEHKHGLDKLIKESINKAYVFSNNVGAIRHALKPGETSDKIKLAEAKYMIVVCSAFINYLKETAAK